MRKSFSMLYIFLGRQDKDDEEKEEISETSETGKDLQI
jgi:hypothetical protein